ncbi:cysteine desulfurase/selenocysteine lyase [Variovorax paradoxus]|nr:family 2A encapsulin nanocompartment cargo protein cysteine desulfurase [Variovorax paradoxus]MDQ0586301.1 cysteine desulfurase/selenocysteine lyase [Variovorax paradoxus]
MSITPSIPGEAPFDPAVLARMASAMFAALPGTPPASLPGAASGLVPGAQFPANVAPPGSPLASPAGFGPSVPGTPFPQGQVPGANLVPASPTQLPSLANRAPALLPHAVAGNGVPDSVLSVAPAFEPRLGSSVLGVPQQANAPATPFAPQAGASPFYFLNNSFGHPPAGAASAVSVLPQVLPPLPLAGEGWGEGQRTTQGAEQPLTPTLSPEGRGSQPQFYFVDAVPLAGSGQHPPFDVNAVRRDFPILQERVNGRQLVWFDNAATTHKPQSVIDRIAYFYAHENSNIHRAAHELAARATDAYEGARERVRLFLNAPEVEEVIFVRGTTEAINLVAKSWGGQHVGEGDEIIVSNLEHHANIVPWQQLAAAKGAKLRVIPVDDSGQVLLDEYRKLLNDRTKIVAVTQVSNALGTVVPVKEIVELAHRAGARALVDGAQSVSHMRVDVQDIGADFFVFSGHKVFGPTGIGVVWGKREVLEDMPPWQGGGNMIADVTFEKTVFQPIPNKFEAGTGNIADAVGLGAAIDYVHKVGIENIARYEHDLLAYGMAQLRAIRGVRLIGTAADKASVMSFVLDGYTTEEVGHALNEEGIAVRTGHHCAQPILRRFGVETTVRPSLAFYNTFDEIDRLVSVVRRLAGQRRAG